MDNMPKETRLASTDIRAPRQSRLDRPSWRWRKALILLISDILALAIAWLGAGYFNQFYSPLPSEFVWWVWLGIPSLFWVFAAATILVFARAHLYQFATQPNYVRAGKLVSLVYLLSLVLCYFTNPKLDPPRSLFFTAWFCSVALVIGLRLIATLILRQFEQSKLQVAVFVIAPAPRLRQLAEVLHTRSHYKIVGAALASTANTAATFRAIINSGAVEVLVEDLPQAKLASTLYWQLRRFSINLRLIPSSREMLYRRGVPEIFAGLPTLRVEAPLLNGWDYRLKRYFDVVGALVGIILASPLFIVVAIAIKLSSPGPIFFRQERVGLRGKSFQMWKFRTMVVGAAALQEQLEAQNRTRDGIMFKIERDPRLIPIGRLLRRTSVDELPQLFNVLLGQMSLVGPRPLPIRDVERFASWHHIRHQVLPGITGLWQISGRSNVEDFSEAVHLDLYYIDNWSLNLDLDILVETIRVVLLARGAY